MATKLAQFPFVRELGSFEWSALARGPLYNPDVIS
jgi:hypothetical protein